MLKIQKEDKGEYTKMKAHKYWSLGALACMAGCFTQAASEIDAGSTSFKHDSPGLPHGHGNYSSQNWVI